MERAAEEDAAGNGEDGAGEGGYEGECDEGEGCADCSDEESAEGCFPAVVGYPSGVGAGRGDLGNGEDCEEAEGGEHGNLIFVGDSE